MQEVERHCREDLNDLNGHKIGKALFELAAIFSEVERSEFLFEDNEITL